MKKTGKYCGQCHDYGHTKWLFLGTHKTHRMYIRYMMWRAKRRTTRELRNRV